MIIEYILVGVVCFTIGVNSGKRKDCVDKNKVVVVHKHKKFRHTPLLRKRHIHQHHKINMMYRSDRKRQNAK
jgi:hypothetical protein